jgi:glycosyltransferase involved in cell wall biosynthesis
LHAWGSFRAYRELRRIFSENSFQIVHTHGVGPGLVGRFAARRAGVPIIVHHVYASPRDDRDSLAKRWLRAGLERLAAYNCDCMVMVNREEHAEVVARRVMPPEHCLTIYSGVDLEAIDPKKRPHFREHFRARLGSSQDEFVVLYLGRLVHAKQPLLLADIAARLDALRPRKPWRLWVAGTGPAEQSLAEAVKARQVEHRVRLLGWQDDPLGVLHAADVVLLPSLAEGLPRALIEAQAAGLPAVASAIRGNREVITEGTGFLCATREAGSYAEALVRLIDSAELRQAQGQRARLHAEECFDATVSGRRVVEVYRSLLTS